MRYLKGLSQETLSVLERIYKQSKYYQVRQRAHCLRLSYQGYQISELMKIFQVSRNTIYNWFENWEKSSLVGLYNHPGRGRRKIFNELQENQIKEWVLATPKNLSQVQEKIGREWGIKTSKDTIKRVIKSLKMGWHRIKRRVADHPIVEFYEQDSSQKIEVKSQRSKRLNVLGFLTRTNQLEVYTFEESINSDVVIACLDSFCQKILKQTVLVMDNSSIHQNNLLWDKEKEWSEKGLRIFFLPTYSPQLNLIEILWRFIKYKWLEVDSYESYSNLVKAVENILKNFGTEYTINFA